MLVFQGLPSDGVVRFGTLRIWAERGLIRIEDSKDNSYEVLSVRTALERLKAINDMIKNSTQRQKHSHDMFDRFLIEAHQKMIDEVVVLVRKAQEQGMPTDASARRDLVRRRPRTFVVPGGPGL